MLLWLKDFLLILKAGIVHESRMTYDSKHCCSIWQDIIMESRFIDEGL